MSNTPVAPRSRETPTDLERILGKAISIGTYAAVGCIAIGVALLLAAGRSPLGAGAAPFDPAGLPRELAAGHAEGFLWLGLVLAIATPIGRVAGALVGYVARGERFFVAVAVAILAVIGIAVVLGLGSV